MPAAMLIEPGIFDGRARWARRAAAAILSLDDIGAEALSDHATQPMACVDGAPTTLYQRADCLRRHVVARVYPLGRSYMNEQRFDSARFSARPIRGLGMTRDRGPNGRPRLNRML